MMKLKHLESALSEVRLFNSPSIELEQIPTSAHLASQIIFQAAQNQDIIGSLIGFILLDYHSNMRY